MKVPLRRLGAAEFEELRRGLEAAGFTESRLLEHDGPGEREVVDAPAALTALFLEHRALAVAELARWIGEPLAGLLERFGLTEADPQMADAVRGAVMLYPAHGLYLASDRQTNLTPDRAEQADVVFAAITPNTNRFMAALPSSACARLLDLGTGSGVAALAGAAHAERVAASDIAQRSVEFAEWNAALNGIANVEFRLGDLFAPFAGQTFDRIVANPPYLPALRQDFIYRDAGEDGEAISSRILSGLDQYLEPGGRLFMTCILSDRKDGPAEDRLRVRLGDGYDIYLAVISESPAGVYFFERASNEGRWADLEAEIAAVRRLGMTSMLYSSLMIERHREPAQAVTWRRRCPEPRPEAFERAAAWEWTKRAPGFEAGALRPRAAAGVRAEMRHEHFDGDWFTAACTLAVDDPVPGEHPGAAWLSSLVMLADGSRTVAELRETLHLDEMPAKEFEALIVELIDEGFLE